MTGYTLRCAVAPCLLICYILVLYVDTSRHLYFKRFVLSFIGIIVPRTVALQAAMV
jgi:hypothetical protein